MASLESENRTIRNEITFAETLITQHPFLSKLYHMALQQQQQQQRDGGSTNPALPSLHPGVPNFSLLPVAGSAGMGSGAFGSVLLGGGVVSNVVETGGVVKQPETVSAPRVLAY